MKNNLVILAGGIASRMKDSGKGGDPSRAGLNGASSQIAKTMIPADETGRPFLDYLLYNAWRAGHRDVVLVIGEKSEAIHNYYKSTSKGRFLHELKISYAVQKIPPSRTKPLGTADALLCGLRSRPDWRSKTFTVCNGDNLYSTKAFQLLLQDEHTNAMIDYDSRALEFDRSRIEKLAVTRKDDKGHLLEIIEKPSAEVVASITDKTGRIGVSMNIFKLEYDRIFPYLETAPLHPQRREKELSTAVHLMVQDHPGSLYAYPLAEHVPDLTSVDDIPIVREYLKKDFQRSEDF